MQTCQCRRLSPTVPTFDGQSQLPCPAHGISCVNYLWRVLNEKSNFVLRTSLKENVQNEGASGDFAPHVPHYLAAIKVLYPPRKKQIPSPLKPFHSQAHNANSPNHSRIKWCSDIVRNDCSINFHLSKLSTAKFSILYDISLVRDWKRKLKLITLGSERVNVIIWLLHQYFWAERSWRDTSPS